MQNIKIEIGGIVLRLAPENTRKKIYLDGAYKKFFTDKRDDINLLVKDDNPATIIPEGNPYHLGTEGILYFSRKKDNVSFNYFSAQKRPYFTLNVNTDLKGGTLQFNCKQTDNPPLSLNYPTISQLLFIHLLSQKEGILFHASGIIDKENGIAFAGNSGSGKTTISHLYKDKNRTVILNDDRVIIRRLENRFYLFGTPWSGSGNFSSATYAPLDKIFFLHHAKDNALKRLTWKESLSMLLNLSFVPFYDSLYMEKVITLCGHLSKKIPTFQLSFKPDKDIWKFIENCEQENSEQKNHPEPQQ